MTLTRNEQNENFLVTSENENEGDTKMDHEKFLNTNSNENTGRTNAKCYAQWIATFTMFLLMMQNGINYGWSSPNIARFATNNSDIFVPPDKLHWLGSTDSLGSAFGAVFGSLSAEFFGPKKTGLIAFVLFTTSWVSMMTARNYVWIIIARFVGGDASTTAVLCTAMYLGEVSDANNRGTLISIAVSGIASGLLFGSFLETYLPATVTCPIYLVQCLVGVALLTLVLPESPYFLMKSCNDEKTKKSLKSYFPNAKVEEKFVEVRNFVEDQAGVGIKSVFKVLKSSPVNKSLLLILALYSLIQAGGFTNVSIYMETILRRGKSFMIEPQKLVLYINIFNTTLRFVTCNLADRLGRKFLLVMASLVMSLAMLSLGIYFHMLRSNFSLDNFEWIPVICILLIKVSFSIGFLTGFTTVLSETFPQKIKNIATCLSYLAGSSLNFVLADVFIPISDSVGEQYMFWVHAVCAFLVTPLVVIFLPETKGKTFEEIQNNLRNR